MDALKSLLDNEKGLVGVGLIIAATVLAALGKMPVDQWQTYSTWVFGIYAGSTALHGGLAALGGKTYILPPPKLDPPATLPDATPTGAK